ncbi:ABC transporter permease [uncultured Enterovirga sp.]|uniref:ABC transporter permease n=1 Tax=uncultured Enterovirga sp. TaxID=2026352 RepID=UPI0035CB007B
MGALAAWVSSHTDILARTAWEHLVLSGVSLAIVVAVAIPLGIALARRGRASGPVVALVNTLRTIPSLALLVVMMPVLGTGMAPSIVALALYGLPAVLLNTMSGLAGIDRDVLDAARGQGLSEPQILARIELPLAAPVILAGIRSAAVQIVSAATLAVFIGGGGFGELISAGMGLLDIPQLVIGALAVAMMAGTVEIGFGWAERGASRRLGLRTA